MPDSALKISFLEDWLQTLMEDAADKIGNAPIEFPEEYEDYGVIADHPLLVDGTEVEASYVVGAVGPHSDLDYPQWSYLLVLFSEDAVLHRQGLEPVELKPGMLVELDLWKEHWLEQGETATFVWRPIDLEYRRALEDVSDNLWDHVVDPEPLIIGGVVRWPHGRVLNRPDRLVMTDYQGEVVLELARDELRGAQRMSGLGEVYDGETRSMERFGAEALWERFLHVARSMYADGTYYDAIVEAQPTWLKAAIERDKERTFDSTGSRP